MYGQRGTLRAKAPIVVLFTAGSSPREDGAQSAIRRPVDRAPAPVRVGVPPLLRAALTVSPHVPKQYGRAADTPWVPHARIRAGGAPVDTRGWADVRADPHI
ncbi:hypothetical protein GCM10010254_32610 [Streptomyces chromofuscus]|nr:hypothetical protein GCM10010254_32610 [Streptomyces chromofuscus]